MKSNQATKFIFGIMILSSLQLMAQADKEMKSTQQERNKAAVRRLYEEVLNTGKFEMAGQFIDSEYSGVRGEKGPAGFTAAVSPVRAAFPNIKWVVEDLIAEGNKVVVRWSWKGINENSFNGFPVTHKEVTQTAIAIYEFKDNLIHKAWMQSDRLGFFQQMGVLSADAINPPAKK